MYNEVSSTKALDVRGMGPTHIKDEVQKLSRDVARAILTEIADAANARRNQLDAALSSGSRKEK